MKQIYTDESGISGGEKVALVAGIIIDADKQWRAVSETLRDLANEYAPKPIAPDFRFHATELYSGSGKFFHKDHYPRERAFEALKRLVWICR